VVVAEEAGLSVLPVARRDAGPELDRKATAAAERVAAIGAVEVVAPGRDLGVHLAAAVVARLGSMAAVLVVAVAGGLVPEAGHSRERLRLFGAIDRSPP